MSRILFINSVCYGSTGSICKNLYKLAEREGHTCCIAFGRGNAPEGFNNIKIGSDVDVYAHALHARILDSSGFQSKNSTKAFIKKIEEFNPDIIHLHNIHGYYVNVEILFNYFRLKPDLKIIWTLHDCWSYTGHCAYYTYANCNQWESICLNCPNKNEYPKTIISNCKKNYEKKKNIFTQLNNLIIVTPSVWLKEDVKQSFLKDYTTIVINNGIDTSVFHYVDSNIKDRFNLTNKKIILGVASVWDKRKGLDYFIELSKEITNDYTIVLVGLNEQQIKNLPSNVIGIKRTESANELVEWYSSAYVLFNPTLEDNYPTVNLESLACGTPVITFDTGGSPEPIEGKYGLVISKDLKSKEIYELIDKGDLSRNSNINFDYNNLFKQYISLYNE